VAAKRKTRTVVRYAKRKTRRAAKFTLPVAVVCGMMPRASSAARGWGNDGLRGLAKGTTYAMTGYDYYAHTFNPSFMWNGTYPIALGILIHKVAGMLGVNRALGRARIPFIRI